MYKLKKKKKNQKTKILYICQCSETSTLNYFKVSGPAIVVFHSGVDLIFHCKVDTEIGIFLSRHSSSS